MEKMVKPVAPVKPTKAPPPSGLAKFAEGVITPDNLREASQDAREKILGALLDKVKGMSDNWEAKSPMSITILRAEDKQYRHKALIGGEQFALYGLRLGAKKNFVAEFLGYWQDHEVSQYEISVNLDRSDSNSTLTDMRSQLPFRHILLAAINQLEKEDWVRKSLSGEDILTETPELYGTW